MQKNIRELFCLPAETCLFFRSDMIRHLNSCRIKKNQRSDHESEIDVYLDIAVLDR
jgi:hypothetical protein